MRVSMPRHSMNFNPRSPHGERHHKDGRTTGRLISIHAPRTGSDLAEFDLQALYQQFQSTLPARGATPPAPASWTASPPFQSTLPARGATGTAAVRGAAATDFNPRSPHGERPTVSTAVTRTKRFQSTLPARGATWCNPPYGRRIGISIHAPRTGSDPRQRLHCPRGADFNPRSPHGERRTPPTTKISAPVFQSTLPARGAT